MTFLGHPRLLMIGTAVGVDTRVCLGGTGMGSELAGKRTTLALRQENEEVY